MDVSGYDGAPFIPDFYDHVVPSASRQDVAFYVDAARQSGAPVLELGCGTGRVLVRTARAGIEIVGLDASDGMLEACRRRLRAESPDVRRRASVERGDMRDFELGHTFRLVTIPFRPFQHLVTVQEQLASLAAVRRHLDRDGRLVLDVFNPSVHCLAKPADGAGAIVIAKSNMHEFAYGWETIGSLFGQTRNPYALRRHPGGSSGGTGAAIAANFAAVGMGSDTCGSIRVPASFNNLVGIRGTQGLSSRAGILPLAHTQDIGGPLGRTVTDVAIVLDATIGYDPADPQTAESLGNIPKSYTESLNLNGLRGARIGVVTNFSGKAEDPAVAAVVQAALDEMRARGAEVVDVAIPNWQALFPAPGDPYFVIAQEFKFDLNAYLAERPSAPVRSLEAVLASGKFSAHDSVAPRLRNSQSVATLDTKEYHEQLARRTSIKQAILKTMADNRLDALTYPTVSQKAALLNELQQLESVNCYLRANSGLPAITVPGGFTADGFPVGVELLGRPWSEPTLIRLAYAYEQATRHRRPPASTPALASSRR